MIYLTQIIHIKEGMEETFHEFEDFAIPLLEQYNGKIIYRIRPDADSMITANEAPPYEIHFISFPSELDFQAFLQDDGRLAFLHLKEQSVKSTLLVKGKALN